MKKIIVKNGLLIDGTSTESKHNQIVVIADKNIEFVGNESDYTVS